MQRSSSSVVKAGARAFALAAVTLLLTACASTYQPWINEPFPAVAEAPAEPSYWSALGGRNNSPDIYFVVAFSGGGMRAAALAYGVLETLRKVRFDWDGHTTSLLDQIDVLSGVSGGSITAAYYAAYGQRGLTAFKNGFLMRDFEADLVAGALAPTNSYRLSSPWFGRGNVLAEELDRVLFHGLTYGQLPRGHTGPTLLITATDLSQGTSFEFSRDQLRLMCSNIDAVPLSVAVAASSAVPVIFSPITLKNYAGTCSSRLPPAPRQASGLARAARRYLAEQSTYLDSARRPYIHLVDGGLSDNLGLRRIVEDSAMAGGLGPALTHADAAGVRKIIILSINAQHRNTYAADRSGSVPSLPAIFNAMDYGFLSRNTRDTYALLARAVVRWRHEIRADTHSGQGPFAKDAEIYDIEVGLRDDPDPRLRKALLAVPTSFALSAEQVRELIAAAPRILQANPEYDRLLRDLGVSGPAHRAR